MPYCKKCLIPDAILDRKIVELIQKEYLKDAHPWFLGFSGGKDSSALLTLTFLALNGLDRKQRLKPVTIIYCDTGVEIPVVTNLVYQTLNSIEAEAKEYQLPLRVKIAMPKLDDRYFVKVIGRGYPPPTNKFRWCTDRLRINPVKNILRSAQSPSTVLLGIRKGESLERDKTIERHSTDEKYYYQQKDNNSTIIFSPLIDYTTKDVWATINFNPLPESIDSERLGSLYKDAGSDCPIIRDPNGTPCGKGRFGCWTCTVVRKDKAVTSMVNEGHYDLAPLLEFRNWLATIRDNINYRCTRRRNGAVGLGPFTLKAREEILYKLLDAQDKTYWPLIQDEEIARIKHYWDKDVTSESYLEE